MSEDLIACVAILGIGIAIAAGVYLASYIQRRNEQRDHRQAFDAWRHQAPQESKPND